MITDKNGKKIELKDILKYLVGTDEFDEAKSVIDFSLYKIKEDKTLDDPNVLPCCFRNNSDSDFIYGTICNDGTRTLEMLVYKYYNRL